MNGLGRNWMRIKGLPILNRFRSERYREKVAPKYSICENTTQAVAVTFQYVFE